jgi:tetratricopeptide (TPR) repeat protein
MEDYKLSVLLSKKYLSRYPNGKELQPTIINIGRTYGRGLNQPDSALIYYDLFAEKGELSVADQVDLAAVYITLGDKANDSLISPTYWFKAAGALSNAGAFETAIIEYLKIVDRFPADTKAPNALFTAAFLYENEMGDNEKALELYKRVAAEYPDNPMGKNAKLYLSQNYVGKSADEIAKSWKKK